MAFALPLDPSMLPSLSLGAGLMIAGFSSTMIGTMLGAGGSLIAIPVLHYFFMQMGFDSNAAMVMTAGTAALCMIMSAPRAILLYMKSDHIDWELAKHLFWATAAGSLVAHFLGLTGSGMVMKIVFATLVTLLGFYMLMPSERRHIISPGDKPHNAVWWVFAFLLGIICPLVGTGGTSVAVPAMVALRVPFRKAAGTSAIVVLAVGITSFIPYAQMEVTGADNMPFTIGAVHVVAALLFFVAGYLGQPVGMWLQQHFTGKQLRHMFAGMLFLSAARFMWLIFAA